MAEQKVSIFDADGMLVRTQHIFDLELVAVGVREGLPITHEFLQSVQGQMPQEWLHQFGVEGQRLDLLMEDLRAKVYVTVSEQAEWIEGVPEMLEELRRADHLLGIVTKSGRKTVAGLTKRLRLHEFFPDDWIVTGQDVSRYKPAPDGLLLAVDRMRVKPHECTYSGDHDTDVQAGKGANFRESILYLGEHTKPEEAHGVKHVARTIGEVRNLLFTI